ncbi:ATPase AAA [Anopheles sinensis]|uniref:ATPase AAA n=1 Tax=Anopheles sinensis TaxID=74873 RepID=A0A084VQM2_ANOSI|nr:ATPase AAA [Anopheles sinensis]
MTSSARKATKTRSSRDRRRRERVSEWKLFVTVEPHSPRSFTISSTGRPHRALKCATKTFGSVSVGSDRSVGRSIGLDVEEGV